jgi:hypothetical protein
MENPTLPSESPRIDPWNIINPWTTNPTTTPRGPHCPAEYQRPARVQKPAPKDSKAISGLGALDIIESLDPDLHAGILEHARTEPPSEPLLISPWNITPTTMLWEPLRVRGDYPQVLALLAKYQNGCANSSLKQIARAEKAFVHMLFWGAFVEVEPGLYQLLPLEELVLIFGGFYGYEELEGIVDFFDEFGGLEQ